MSRTDWRTATLVLLLHLLLFGALHTLMRRPAPSAVAQSALQWITLPPLTQPPPVPARRVPPAAPPPSTRPAAPTLPAPTAAPQEAQLRLVEAPSAPVPVEPPASAASAPRTRLLDSAASRQALRQLGSQPLLSERAARATDTDIQRTDTALANDVKAAQHGDCLKGEFAGSGMGLLSLPALAVAAARGQCAR